MLDDDVKDCVKGLGLSAENYVHAKEILEERFGNKQLSVNVHMKALIKLPSVEFLNMLDGSCKDNILEALDQQ